jgi:hypothetical protein
MEAGKEIIVFGFKVLFWVTIGLTLVLLKTFFDSTDY